MDALASAHEAVSAHHGNNYLPLLDQHYRSHRPALFTLAEAIELEATTAERSVLEAVEFLRELRGAKAIAAEGHPVDLDDLATISPYITHTIRRFGNWMLNLTPPAAEPTTRLDLEPRVLFAP
ncbi:hypothetical protein [Streptosporangium sp. NBC_01756]|uniref:hypothetical protein n=1 Tax=Streptosporangium sp. NBC_01756 TaxID=2975950 RepID=UPI002DDAA2C1|nr:hypothetical protein [Streptosporangium sp. NBC_01756]WSC89579.1 hypothetical protein OIE48_15775 [Streptosporangium sp. NBC_01756]